MIGTSFSHTLEMLRTPPKMTKATASAITRAIASVGMPGKLDWMMPVMAADCTAEPVPSVAITANTQKSTAPRWAHDRAGAHGRGERGGKRPELGDVAFSAFVFGNRKLDGRAQLPLDEAGAHGQEDMRAEQEHDHDRAPHSRIDLGEYIYKIHS